MDEFYRAIEERIHQTGYKRPVDGEQIYNDICDEIEDKENGTYLFLSKPEDDILFEYKVDVMDEEFNLVYIDITAGDSSYHAVFDA